MINKELLKDYEAKTLRELGVSEKMIEIFRNCSVHRSNSGLEFHDRKTGSHFLFDEVPCYPDNAPRYLSIALTNECNLHCSFCYVDKHRTQMLDPEMVKSVILTAEEKGTLGVSFGGGEPTLYLFLKDILKFTHEETRLAVGITSNCTEELIKLTPEIHEYVDFLRISMDGIDDTYTAHRNIPFSVFRERISYLSQFYKLGINYLVDETTIDDLDKAFVLMKEWGIRELLLLPKEPDCPDAVMQRLNSWINENKDKGILLEISEFRRGDLPALGAYRDDDNSLNYAHIDAKGLLKRSSYVDIGLGLKQYYDRNYRPALWHTSLNPDVFMYFRTLYENKAGLTGLIKITAEFTSKEKLQKFYDYFFDLRDASKQYEEDLYTTGYSLVKIPNQDPFVFIKEYFLAFGNHHQLYQIDDTSIMIISESKTYPAFIYVLVGSGALVSVRYLDKEKPE